MGDSVELAASKSRLTKRVGYIGRKGGMKRDMKV